MIFELPDIFFGSHPKKEKVSQPMQMGQCGFTKKSEKALPQAAFSKNPVISFSVQRAIRKELAFAGAFLYEIESSAHKGFSL